MSETSTVGVVKYEVNVTLSVSPAELRQLKTLTRAAHVQMDELITEFAKNLVGVNYELTEKQKTLNVLAGAWYDVLRIN